MTDITINIDEYLSDEEKRQIARDEFRAACARRSTVDFERILSNAAYELVHQEVDAIFDGGMADAVRANAVKIIKNLSSYSVFTPPTHWDRASKGWTCLQDAIEAAKPIMTERVLEIVTNMDADYLRGIIDGLIVDVIVAKLTTPAKVEA